MQTTSKIFKIVLTGGPCSGKTTSIPIIKEYFEKQGIPVFCVCEQASRFLQYTSDHSCFLFQKLIFSSQKSEEDNMFEYVKGLNLQKAIILLDRGLIDGRAYNVPQNWDALVDNIDSSILGEQRYDAVIHLRSVALDLPHLYSADNNENRYETLEEAIQQDQRTLDAWLGHPKLKVIGNDGNFEEKVQLLIKHIEHIISDNPLEIEKRFLIQRPFVLNFGDIVIHRSEIFQIYTDKGRIRKRTVSGQRGEIYTLTQKREISLGVREECETHIDKDFYNQFYELFYLNKGCPVLYKERICFIYKNQHFELDVFDERVLGKGLAILEIELLETNQTIELPPFLKIFKDITNDAEYSNYNLAQNEIKY